MKTITAADAKRRWDAFLAMVQEEPVFVYEGGREVAVAVSPQLYTELTAGRETPSGGGRNGHRHDGRR